jgi:hypothetical protein
MLMHARARPATADFLLIVLKTLLEQKKDLKCAITGLSHCNAGASC